MLRVWLFFLRTRQIDTARRKFSNKPTRHHNQSLEPRWEGRGTVAVLEFVTRCFDGVAVVVKEVGGLKAGWEEKVWRVVLANHAGERR